MEARLWKYRVAGVMGGLMLAAGHFFGRLCLLQLAAFVPVMLLSARDKKPGWSALAGLYMGLAFTIPQMIYLRMPLPVTAALMVEFTLLLVILCCLAGWCIRQQTILGCFAFGAGWMLLDWLNYTGIPIWGLAQTFARGWTAYPLLIGFISITGISGVLFVIGSIQALAVVGCISKQRRKVAGVLILGILLLIAAADILPLLGQPVATLRVAAAGWIFDDLKKTNDPHTEEGFKMLFVNPAAEAAAQGAAIFTTGELGFYIADHDRQEWMTRFADIAKKYNLFLVVGYFNITADENRIFFMTPAGDIAAEYTKTHLTPFEQGKKGNGNLLTIEVNGIKVGAMICQDDNFSRLTRYYGRLKTPIILCPTADWQTIKDAHLQAVRARAIECRYAIVRGAANGISAIISPHGKVLAQKDHYRQGAGYVIAEVPINEDRTFFSRFGCAPTLIVCSGIIAGYLLQTQTASRRHRAK